ncbi:uncharacterized protein BXZ73DRAFT_96651 [Epithele typhae]|uniref:uncharacterized protein n=1 Tax=Epithele typhae TaxID=378194 RepID=UPI0020079144|nr:uncharacterized protein BXZ73DRAFT_96651 [Epithele typhae]KAH9944156.1 hypothetical protein BXZ73DRAFT_96651 [Epithele typhae]
MQVEDRTPNDLVQSERGPPLPRALAGDPPWDDGRASESERAVPSVAGGHAPKQTSTGTPQSVPTTQEELLENLVFALATRPRPSIAQAVAYHARFPSLHSTASFNLLIRYAIRQATFGTVRHLLAQMVRDRILGDEETRALRVRCMVRMGLWTRAWREEQEQAEVQESGLPARIWYEFWDSVKQGAISDVERVRGRVATARIRRLQAAPARRRRVPQHVVQAFVRSLVAQGRRDAASTVASEYIRSLPPTLDARLRDGGLALIHLLLAPGSRRPKLSAHFAALKTLFTFLDMHRGLRPTAQTLDFLLRGLLRSRHGGARADRLVSTFRKRWGDGIADDPGVRRRWAALWFRQGDGERARAISQAQNKADRRRRRRARNEGTTAGHDIGKARWMGRLERHRAPRIDRERWAWRQLRIRMARAKKRAREAAGHAPG